MSPVIQRLDLRSPAFKDQPDFLWRELHQCGPVIRTRIPLLGKVALATRQEQASQIFRNTADFSVDGRRVGYTQSAGLKWWVPSIFRVLANNMLTVDGQEHRQLRQHVDHAFRRDRLQQFQATIDRLTARYLDRFCEQLEQWGKADFVKLIARPFPQHVISELLGLPQELIISGSKLDRALQQLSSIQGPLDLFRVVPAIRIINRALKAEIDKRRQRPCDDFLSDLVMPSTDGLLLSDETLLAMLFLLYVAGHETTTHLLSNSLLTLLREKPDFIRDQHSLDHQAVGELLRYTSPVQMSKPRFATRELDLGGTILKKGDTAAVLIAAVNRDDEWIENPDTLDFQRRPMRHAGFGGGPHVCLGMHLALNESVTVLNAMINARPGIQICKPDTMPDWNSRLGLRALNSLWLYSR